MSGEPNGCGVVVFSWRRAQAHYSLVPTAGGLSSCQASPKRGLEAGVESFHQAVRLRMVDCYLGVLDVQQVAHGSPQGGGELGAAVRCDDHQDTESAHPPLKQSICAVYCCGGRERDSLTPHGDSVHNSK